MLVLNGFVDVLCSIVFGCMFWVLSGFVDVRVLIFGGYKVVMVFGSKQIVITSSHNLRNKDTSKQTRNV